MSKYRRLLPNTPDTPDTGLHSGLNGSYFPPPGHPGVASPPETPAAQNGNALIGASKGVLPPRRAPVTGACEVCREKKTKCDGARPICGRCGQLGLTCDYIGQRGETRAVATKRKSHALDAENNQLRLLYDFIHTRPEAEALEIFRRMRATRDPIAVLAAVRDADLLLRNPTTASSYPGLARIQQLDQDALATSAIKVPARPWTNVARDGLVSELVTSFFAWDRFQYAFVNHRAFLNDMKNSTVEKASYCSPFLVNAMCALRSIASERVKVMGHHMNQDLSNEFSKEAKVLLEAERGKATLPTVQGLCLLFMHSASRGRDQEGQAYRYMAFHLLRRLNLEAKFCQLNAADASNKQVISAALWGLFNFESATSFLFGKASTMPPPLVPQPFECEVDQSSKDGHNLDLTGRPFGESSPQPPIIDHVINHMCDLSLLLYKSQRYNNRAVLEGPTGSTESEVSKRSQFYSDLVAWMESLPARFRDEENPTPQTCFLRIYMNLCAYSILRPLPPGIHLENGSIVKDLIIKHCELDVETSERYAQRWPAAVAIMFITASFNVILTLVSLLDYPQAQDAFTRACAMARRTDRYYPIGRVAMQGALAAAKSMKKKIPPSARPFFANLHTESDTKELRVTYAIPKQEEMAMMFSDPSSTEYLYHENQVWEFVDMMNKTSTGD